MLPSSLPWNVAVPVVEVEEDFGVVVAGVVGGLDEEGAEEAAVEAFAEVVSGADVGVEPAEAGRVGREGVAGVEAPGAIMGVPSSMAPSISEGRKRPCQ